MAYFSQNRHFLRRWINASLPVQSEIKAALEIKLMPLPLKTVIVKSKDL